MKALLKNLRPDWLTVASAVLIAFSFAPWDFYPLIWVALIPWFFALLRSQTIRAAVIQGVWLSVLMSLFGFFWVAFAIHEFGQVPWIFSILGLGLFGIGGQPQFPVFAALFFLTRTRFRPKLRVGYLGALFAVLLGLTYVGIDWLIPKLFMDTLGHSLYLARHLRQAADLGGAHLLSFQIFVVNFALFTLAERGRSRGEPSIWPALSAALPQLGVATLLCLAGWGYGSWRLGQLSTELSRPLGNLQAAVIQGNVGDLEKLAAERGLREAAERVVHMMLGLSDQALTQQPRPDVVIWPETTYPSTFRTPRNPDELSRDLKMERFVSERSVPLLFGGYDSDGQKDFNTFFFLTPTALTRTSSSDGNSLQIYHKNVLLPFGEYVPGFENVRWFRKLFPQMGFFGRGPGSEIMKIQTANRALPVVLASPVICYEALFPEYVIRAARKGSQLILNITNDSWFGSWGEPHLHLALSVFRSIEARLPQLRGTNTGISALISQDGEIVQRTGIGTQEIMNARIPVLQPIPTLMKKWGDWFGWFAFCAGTLGLLALSPWIDRVRRPRG